MNCTLALPEVSQEFLVRVLKISHFDAQMSTKAVSPGEMPMKIASKARINAEAAERRPKR